MIIKTAGINLETDVDSIAIKWDIDATPFDIGECEARGTRENIILTHEVQLFKHCLRNTDVY